MAIHKRACIEGVLFVLNQEAIASYKCDPHPIEAEIVSRAADLLG
jgi:hypothetical protein